MNELGNRTTALIGVDWGISRLRAYCMGQDGEIFQHRDSALGISAIPNKDFATALSGLIGDWLKEAPEAPILLCGMIGSRHGWYEAPYSACPTSLLEVAQNSLTIEVEGRPACIVGGISATDEQARHDVIRGEETQIFGVAGPSGRQLIIAPGTHSKWATVREGVIEDFRTYMTGELYALLTQHSSLGWSTKEVQEGAHHEQSFLEGVHHSLKDPDLLHSLFPVRTRSLFKNHDSNAHISYLSGVLIGNEVSNGLRGYRAEAITLIASPKLAQLYLAAFAAAGIDSIERIDGDVAVTRGLWRLSQLRIDSQTP
jgi:2-dehydro-3-deoxygalactonokinase